MDARACWLRGQNLPKNNEERQESDFEQPKLDNRWTKPVKVWTKARQSCDRKCLGERREISTNGKLVEGLGATGLFVDVCCRIECAFVRIPSFLCV